MIDIKSLDIKMVRVEEVRNNPENNNNHPDDQIKRLCEIIEHNGFRDPLIVSLRTGFLICGHGRLIAAKKLGMVEVPVSYQEFDSEEEEYQFMTAHNAIASWSELDLGQVNSKILDLGPDLDIDMLGIKDFVIEPAEKYEELNEDITPEIKEDPVTKKGDVWILGEHRLMCGDSTLIDDVEKLMNGEKADMVFTDPPYNIASDSKNFAANKSKSMNDLKNAEWDKDFRITDFLSLLPIITKDSCAYYVWTSHFLISEIWSYAKENMDFYSYLVWSKPNPMPSLSKRHPTWNTELCAYFTRGSKRDVNFPENKHFLSCREVIKKSDGTHPTQKPLELIEPLIRFSSNESKLVLDLFLGSGSTLIACEKTKRKCFGMELDEKYCDLIIKRWENLTGKEAKLESSGETYNSMLPTGSKQD